MTVGSARRFSGLPRTGPFPSSRTTNPNSDRVDHGTKGATDGTRHDRCNRANGLWTPRNTHGVAIQTRMITSSVSSKGIGTWLQIHHASFAVRHECVALDEPGLCASHATCVHLKFAVSHWESTTVKCTSRGVTCQVDARVFEP